MGKSIMCSIMVFGSGGKKDAGKPAILQICQNSGKEWRLVLSQSQHINLNFGDKIKCISGTAGIHFNVYGNSPVYILTQKPSSDRHFVSELEINEETTKRLPSRGKISVTSDIGTVLTATPHSVR